MTKTVDVEILDKSCETCPMFELWDEKISISSMGEDESFHYNYMCAHQDFCRSVLKNWEKYYKEEHQ